ncbi:MAG TPA: hypothetical protein VF268_06340 [Gammaproteobacteria bacterium]
MSLDMQYFQERGEKQATLEALGYVDLDAFMKMYHVTRDHLLQAGLIQEKILYTTADLFDFDVSQKGRRWFKTIKSLQIIMIHQDNMNALLQAIFSSGR